MPPPWDAWSAVVPPCRRYCWAPSPSAASRIATAGASSSLAIGCLFAAPPSSESLDDPNLNAGVIVALVPMIVALYGIGRLVESRTKLVTDLGERNEALRQQRATHRGGGDPGRPGADRRAAWTSP